MNNIKKMLPFLEEEQLEELAQKMEENNGEYKELRLETLLPFMDDNYVNQLFLNRMQQGKPAHTLAPFVSDKVMDKMVDDCIEGRLSTDLSKLLPFLEEDTIGKLSAKLSHEEEFCGIKLATLLPFMEDSDIDKLLLDRLYTGKSFSFILPFANDEVLHQIVTEYIEGKTDIDINPFLPFLEDEDIKRLFQYEVNKRD
jgi:hypothetical protein